MRIRPAAALVVLRVAGCSPLAGDGTYSICYLNPFRTQADEDGAQRPDERSAWPADLVLSELGDDPGWGGEYLVDISTAAERQRAAARVEQMTDACAAECFDAACESVGEEVAVVRRDRDVTEPGSTAYQFATC